MASGKSNYWANKLLNKTFNGAAVAFPASVWIRFYTTELTAGGAGTEVDADGYAPVEIVCNATNFPVVADRSMENAAEIVVGTAGEDWGELLAWGVWDAETAGNLLWWGGIAGGVEVVESAVVKIPAGMLKFEENNEA